MEYIILIAALVAIVLGADQLVSGAVSISKRMHVSDFVTGAVVIGIGTSLPELIVSVIGAAEGNSDVAIGNVIGSNIFNVFAILGLTSIIMPCPVSKSNLKFEIPFCIFVSVMVMLMSYNFFNGNKPEIGRADGIILILMFLAFMTLSLARGRQNDANRKAAVSEDTTPLWLAAIKTVGGLAVLITGCHFFVDEAVEIAHKIGVNNAFISITLIACGTSLPELAASVAAAAKKTPQMALGNVVGSNIFNITLILGTSSQVAPLGIGGITPIDYLVMIGAALMTLICGIRGKTTRLCGTVMFSCFVAYNAWLISAQIA